MGSMLGGTPNHGEGEVAPRAIRAKNFDCTVTGSTVLGPMFHRVHCEGAELLHAAGSHPTMWARFWFPNSSRPHRRAFTLINANIDRGSFDIDVHLHGGTAGRWAQTVSAGDTITATLQGTGFSAPRLSTQRMHLIGDPASVPAIRTILEALPHIPASIWLEFPGTEEAALPLVVREGDVLVREPRGDGTQLVQSVEAGARFQQAEHGLEHTWFWLASEAAANRALLVALRRDFGVARSSISAMAYWRAHG